MQAQGLFDSTDLQQVLYKDAARRGYGHAYDDDQVILLTKERVPQLSSRLVPVQAGDKISLSTYVHYSSAPAKKTWQKIGATAAGLAIGSLPQLLDRNKSDGEGGAGSDLLKKAAPLAGAGVAALPFVLNKRKGKAISKNLNMPMSKNGIFVPDAYLSYTFYDLEGKVLSSEVQSIDKNAKDAWQQLSLQAIAPQDGYVQVEVGNGSKRPVWVDGFEYVRKRRSEKTTAKSRMRTNTSSEEPSVVPIDTAFSQFIGEDDTRWPEPPDYGPRPGPGLVLVCNEICIDRIPNYNYQGQTEYYCFDDCVWEYAGTPEETPPPPPEEGTEPDIDNSDNPDNPDDGGDPDGNPNGSPSGTPSAPVPPQNQTPNNQYQAQVIQDRCLGFKRMLELQSQHNKEQIGLLTTDGYVIILPWDGHTKTTSVTRNTYDYNGKRVISFDKNEEGLWTVIIRDDSQGKAVFYEYHVYGHVHSHPQDGNHNEPSPYDKAFATSYFGSIPELFILNKYNLVHYDETGKTDHERHGCN